MKIETGTDNLMVMASHRYCLGRSSYIVSECVRWLINHWTKIDRNTQLIILRDTIEALEEDKAGMEIDKKEWKRFLWLVLPELDEEQKHGLRSQLHTVDLDHYYLRHVKHLL